MALAVLSFALVGLGVSAAGTTLLVLLAKRVAAERRAAAATTVWVMMIVGFAVTAGLAGLWLDPYSPQRLMTVSAVVSTLAVAVAALALRGLEDAAPEAPAEAPSSAPHCAKSGAMPMRAASPSSCSWRCWPTARRT